jgi:c-di-AMP phosphodiesterase-like protein
MLYYFFRWLLLNFTDVYISNILNYCILIVFSLLFLILIIFVICKKEFKVLFIFCLILSVFILFVEMISLFSYRKSDDYYIEKYNHFEQKRMNCLKKCMHVDNYNLSNFKEWYKFNY